LAKTKCVGAVDVKKGQESSKRKFLRRGVKD
jgi:hypothetical protein